MGIPLSAITAPANRHDSPLLAPTLDAVVETLGGLPEGTSVHLDRGYDSDLTRERLEDRGLLWESSKKGKPAPFWATNRWVVERTSSWHNAHKKLVWCTERRGRVIDFWVAFSEVVIIVRRLIREAWSRYRWETRPSRRPWPIRAGSKTAPRPSFLSFSIPLFTEVPRTSMEFSEV
jgi:IS5 family transposase